MSTIMGTFECTNALNISDDQWIECLIKIDDDIMQMYSCLDHIIIISSPYKLTDIKRQLRQFVIQTFGNESIVFCFDIIFSFITHNKRYIQHQITSNYIETINENKEDKMYKWSMNSYNNAIETNALIIINTKTCEFIAIPRNVKDLFEWKISWTKYMINPSQLQSITYVRSFYLTYKEFIYECDLFAKTIERICKKIQNKQSSSHFVLSEDWTKRTHFTGIRLIGYLCDSGVIIQGDLLRHKVGKVFIHFNTDAGHYGKKYDWIVVPNNRICPPPKIRPPVTGAFSTTLCE
eukprot:471029_1